MTDPSSPSFAISIDSDGYTTTGKIMGRQAAGEGFLNGLVRKWPKANLEGVVTGAFNRGELLGQLKTYGFQGALRLSRPPLFEGAVAAGALYYPTITIESLARFRNRIAPAAFSLMGITHTISSDRALDGIGNLSNAPFMPWDALICTSHAALQVVEDLLEERREERRRETGATRFDKLQTPVIPLGVDCGRWARVPARKAQARANLGLQHDEVAFLFAGRLSFHAKANPAQLYQALQAISGSAKIVCIEAGLYAHDGVRKAFAEAQQALAPDVRFIHAPGDDKAAYADAWNAADVFTSLSDNVQETFGLTPVEAMAAGLPVVVSDWNGYRSNVRPGVDGFLIPTTAAPDGAGPDLGLAVEAAQMTYDRQIGYLSLGVAVDRRALEAALRGLAVDPELRARMGAAGRRHAETTFDWSVVLAAYEALTKALAAIRAGGADRPPQPWLQRSDPFRRFAAFATRRTADSDLVTLASEGEAALRTILGLNLASYNFDPAFLDKDLPGQLVDVLVRAGGPVTVESLVSAVGGASPVRRRALAWLLKFGVVEISGS